MKKKKYFLQYLFGTFDIFKKEIIIEDNIKKFWAWNFILLKRHNFFLIKPLLTMVLALLLFGSLICMIYIKNKKRKPQAFILL